MAAPTAITSDTIDRLATEIVQVPIAPSQQPAIAGLLNALAGDMQAFRKFDLRNSEPATTYTSFEGQP